MGTESLDDTPTPPDSAAAAIIQVAEDAKAYAAARIELAKTSARVRLAAGRSGLFLGVVALVLALAAVGALLVGLIASLATLVGPLGATAIVVGLTLMLAGLLGWLARKRLSAAFGNGE